MARLLGGDGTNQTEKRVFPNQRDTEIAVETVGQFKTATGSKMKVIFNVLKTWISKSTEDYSQKIERLKAELQDADAILIGAGSGLSASAGLTYSSARFLKYFSDFHEKYGITDTYSGGFYPFTSLEEYWAWWTRHIYYNRYDVTPGRPYADLLELVRGRNYFVLTTMWTIRFSWLVSIKRGCSTRRATMVSGSAVNRAIRRLMITKLPSAG